VLENLPLLAKRDFTMLSRLSGLDESEIVDILKEIRSLDPKSCIKQLLTKTCSYGIMSRHLLQTTTKFDNR